MGAVIGDYTVTFAMQTGDANPVTVVKANSLVPANIAPERKGYTVEWFKEAGCTNKWNFASDLVTQDITLYAKWTETVALNLLAVSDGILTPTFNPEVTQYTVEVPNIVSSITLTAIANQTDATITGAGVRNLAVGANTFNIVVSNANATSAKIYTITVTRKAPLSGLDNAEADIIRVYPNPVRDQVVIENAAAKHITVYAVDGVKVYENPHLSAREVISVAGWSTGLYVIKIQTSDGSVVLIEKIIKE
jgi:uncharacterized repeat protein (TIGR02543 family)